jgi:DNA-binding response OmpR family regulator
MKAKLLYVEDDEVLGFITKDNLELNDFEVHHCVDGKSALRAIENEVFDLCILDIMLPEIDGFEIAETIRKKDKATPIIFLSAKSMKEDRIKGLKIGADDYLTKPFSIEELILKIEVFLKRSNINMNSNQSLFNLGKFEFDYDNYVLTMEEYSKSMTQREADLLKYLLERKNVIVKRSEILEAIWGEDDYFLGRSLDVFISRLRKSISKDPDLKIENIHGVGFRLVV